MEPWRLAIVGSREFDEWWGLSAVRGIIDDVLENYNIGLVISGGAPGVDSVAALRAQMHAIPTKIYRPKNPRWEPQGYKERNMLIAQNCTQLLCIRSKSAKTYGSGWTADHAEQLGREVLRVEL